MHTCPLFRNFPQAKRLAASATCTVASTMAGLFPPSSRVTDAKLSAAACITLRPMPVPPVKQMCWKGRRVKNALSSAPPKMTLATSAGKASFTTLAIQSAVCGVCSEGFTMTLLPAASAQTRGRSVSIMGKFQGAITSTCPLGWCWMKDLVPTIVRGVGVRWGDIHPRRCFRANRISFFTGNTSCKRTSSRGLPKSLCKASTSASWWASMAFQSWLSQARRWSAVGTRRS